MNRLYPHLGKEEAVVLLNEAYADRQVAMRKREPRADAIKHGLMEDSAGLVKGYQKVHDVSDKELEKALDHVRKELPSISQKKQGKGR